MKFVFAFEKLLQHKRNVEDATRRDVNVAAEKLDGVEKELQAMYSAIDASRKRADDCAKIPSPGSGSRSKLSSPGSRNTHDSKSNLLKPMLISPLTALVQIDEFISGQGVRIALQKKRVREYKAIVEEAQELLLEAAKERKIYEKLREQRLAEFKDSEKKRELKRVDDMVSTRFGRNSG